MGIGVGWVIKGVGSVGGGKEGNMVMLIRGGVEGGRGGSWGGSGGYCELVGLRGR